MLLNKLGAFACPLFLAFLAASIGVSVQQCSFPLGLVDFLDYTQDLVGIIGVALNGGRECCISAMYSKVEEDTLSRLGIEIETDCFLSAQRYHILRGNFPYQSRGYPRSPMPTGAVVPACA